MDYKAKAEELSYENKTYKIEAALRECAAEAYEDAAKGTQKFLVGDGAMMKFRTAVAFWLERKAALLRAPEVKTEERSCRCNANKTPCDSCEDAAYPQECVCETSGQPHGDGYSCPPAPPSPDEKPEQEKL